MWQPIILKLQIISLSASANKLSNIQKQADEYAAMIMEELDPNNLGYIMVLLKLTLKTLIIGALTEHNINYSWVTWQIENLEMLLLQAPNQSVRGHESRNLSQMLSQKLKPTIEPNPIVRWYKDFRYKNVTSTLTFYS